MNRDLIWRNFAASVWVLIAVCAYEAAMNLLRASDIDAQYGPFAARVALWPFAVGGMELMLWYRPFRHREAGCRIMAGFVGIVLILFALLVPLIVGDLYDKAIRWPEWVLFLYAALSHLHFALFWPGR